MTMLHNSANMIYYLEIYLLMDVICSCVVDAGWGGWGEWTSCTGGGCTGDNQMKRTRYCNTPNAALNGGICSPFTNVQEIPSSE